MRVDVRKVDDVVIVDLHGRFVEGEGDDLLRKVVDQLLADGYGRILLNLTEVPAIDSTGAGELAASLRTCRQFGAQIKLLRPQDRVEKSLSISQILPLFEVHADEARALGSFSPEAAGPA